ncbi:GhoT/OrtT family toxin [Pluralibacter gergoviae]
MSSGQCIVVIYLAMAVFSGLIIGFLSRDKSSIRLLAGIVIGLTWPLSLPVALLFAIF